MKDGHTGSSSLAAISKQQIATDPRHDTRLLGSSVARYLSKMLTDMNKVSTLYPLISEIDSIRLIIEALVSLVIESGLV